MTTFELTCAVYFLYSMLAALLLPNYYTPMTDFQFHPPDEIVSDWQGGLVVWDPSPDGEEITVTDPAPDTEEVTAEDVATIWESLEPLTELPPEFWERLDPPVEEEPLIEETNAGWYVTYKGHPFGNRYPTREAAELAYAEAVDRVLQIDPFGTHWPAGEFSVDVACANRRNNAPWVSVKPAWKDETTGRAYSLAVPENLKLLHDALLMKLAERNWAEYGEAVMEYLKEYPTKLP